MVNPLRFVSSYCWVDNVAVVKAEEDCMIWILRIMWRQLLRLFPRDPRSRVFDDALSLSYVSRRENPFPMDARSTYLHWLLR